MYVVFKFLFMLLQRELKYSHEVRILDRIVKRSVSEKQSHCFFTNEILPFFLRHLSKPGQIASFNFFIRKFLVLYLYLDVCFIYITKNLFSIV